MKIKIVKDGLYANIERRAQECKAGDELETGNAYAMSLVADGYAEFIESAEPEEAPKKARRGKKDLQAAQRAEKFVNPFAG